MNTKGEMEDATLEYEIKLVIELYGRVVNFTPLSFHTIYQ